MIVKFRLVAGSLEEAQEFMDRMVDQGAECEMFEDQPYLDVHRLVPAPDSEYLQLEANRGPFLPTEMTEDDIDDDEVLVEHDWPPVWVVECDQLPKGLKVKP